MRTAILSLIGFTAFVLCPTTCPVNAEIAATEKHSMHNEMHADAGDTHHDHEEEPCEHCEANAEVELALMSGGSSIVVQMPSALFTFITYYSNTPVEHMNTGVPRSHLAAIGPPIAPSIVRTIVLRT